MAAVTNNTGWLATSNSAITQQMKWRITPGDAASNKSTVEVWYYLKKNPAIQNTKTSSTDSSFVITIAGQTHKEQHVYKEVPPDNAEHLMISKAFTVSHKTDGTMSATIAVSGGLAGTTISSLSVSRTITFPIIPRASEITSVTDAFVGGSTRITWTPYAGSFHYAVKLSIGDWSYTSPLIFPGVVDSYTDAEQIPLAVASQITQSVRGTMTATLYTYSDSEGNVLVGSEQSKTFTVTVSDSFVPTMTSMTATAVNDNEAVAEWGINLEGYTKFRISASATAEQGASIASYTIGGAYSATAEAAVDGSMVTYTGEPVTGSGNLTFTVGATDSRGYSSDTLSTTKYVFPYSPPTISSMMVSRDTTNDTRLALRVDCTYSSCDGNNSVTAVLMYRVAGTPSYTEYGTVSVNESVILDTNLSEENRYEIVVLLTDEVGNGATASGEVPTATVLLDFRHGGKGLGIGKIAESDRLEIGLDTDFSGDVYIDGVDLDTYVTRKQATIVSVTEYYARNNSLSEPADNEFGTTVVVPTQSEKYVWMYEVTTYSAGSPERSNKRIVSIYGPKGDPGDGATSYRLAVSHAAIVMADDGTYTPSTITVSGKAFSGSSSVSDYAGRFKIETTANNTSWTTSYQSSTNQSSYSFTIPTGTVAVRCSLYQKDGLTVLFDQQVIPVVSDGTSGGDGYTVILTNNNHSFAGDEEKALPSNTTTGFNIAECGVVAYRGTTQLATTIGTIKGTPTGMTTSITNNGQTNTVVKVSVTAAMVSRNGVLDIPVTVDGNRTFNMKFTFSLVLKGEDREGGLSIMVESSAGEVFKNSRGSTTLTAIVFQGGSELDASGSSLTYLWSRYDKDGTKDTSWSASTKSITVTANDVSDKAIYSVDVSW